MNAPLSDVRTGVGERAPREWAPAVTHFSFLQAGSRPRWTPRRRSDALFRSIFMEHRVVQRPFAALVAGRELPGFSSISPSVCPGLSVLPAKAEWSRAYRVARKSMLPCRRGAPPWRWPWSRLSFLGVGRFRFLCGGVWPLWCRNRIGRPTAGGLERIGELPDGFAFRSHFKYEAIGARVDQGVSVPKAGSRR